jgi:hypothetical protein
MRLKRLDGACCGGTCPTLYESDRGTIVVQGWKVTEADVDVPDGEALVEIPRELLRSIENA